MTGAELSVSLLRAHNEATRLAGEGPPSSRATFLLMARIARHGISHPVLGDGERLLSDLRKIYCGALTIGRLCHGARGQRHDRIAV